MTKEEIDILWHKAMRLSIEDGDQFTRYRFAELVAEAEREACAKVCEPLLERPCGYQGAWEGYGKFKTQMTGQECAAAIRARGETK